MIKSLFHFPAITWVVRVLVPLSANQEIHQIHYFQTRNHVIKVIQSPMIKILSQPTTTSLSLPRRPINHRDQEATQITRNRKPAEQERSPQAPHIRGKLLVEELDKRNNREPFRQPRHHKLRNQQIPRHGRGRIRQPSPMTLHQRGYDHGHYPEQGSDAYSLQDCDSGFFFRDEPENRNQNPVVHRNPDGERYHGDDVVSCCGDLEIDGPDWTPVGLEGLEYDVVLDLDQNYVVYDSGYPDWD